MTNWKDLRWLPWSGRKHTLEIGGRVYEYFIFASVAWCCYDDDAACVAAITAASTTTPDAREFMLKYLNVVALLYGDDTRRSKALDLFRTVEQTAGSQSLSIEEKLVLLRILRAKDPEYHGAWRRLRVDPEVFCRRHTEINTVRQGWPQWLHDAMYGCARVCPNCRRTNAASAGRCDCGHALTDRDCPNLC